MLQPLDLMLRISDFQNNFTAFRCFGVIELNYFALPFNDYRCGHCKGQQPCKVTEGRCITCDRGWNGTRCDQLCSKGFFGENCQEVCPTCKDGHHCDPIHGKCSHCNPGWIGDRYEDMYSLGQNVLLFSQSL